jgi:hypothetical protein
MIGLSGSILATVHEPVAGTRETPFGTATSWSVAGGAAAVVATGWRRVKITPSSAPYLGAFRQGLNDLGYVESKNFIPENRFAAELYD